MLYRHTPHIKLMPTITFITPCAKSLSIKTLVLYKCGDFNARCGDSSDFIKGIDNLPLRSVIAYSHNAYSEMFIDFLINVNCCIVNGRNSVHNDLTFVSPLSCSVVDYCLMPYENLCNISIFSVIRASKLATDAGVIGQVNPASKLPDHSVRRWSFNLDCTFSSLVQNTSTSIKIKYNVKNIPNDFLADGGTSEKFAHVIDEIESSKVSTKRMMNFAVLLKIQ